MQKKKSLYALVILTLDASFNASSNISSAYEYTLYNVFTFDLTFYQKENSGEIMYFCDK